MPRAPRQAVVDAGFLELLRYGMRKRALAHRGLTARGGGRAQRGAGGWPRAPADTRGRSMTPVTLPPSILSADFPPLGQPIAEVEAAGAERAHVGRLDV